MALQPVALFRTFPSLALVAACLCAPACSPKPATSPHSALTAYTDALSDGRLEDAYGLLSAKSREELSFQDFKKLVEAHPEEVKELLEAAQKERHPPLVQAEFTAEDGTTLTLLYENGAWRIDQSAVNLYDQTEPRASLESFIRAFERKRYDVLLNFVPKSQQEGLTEAKLKESFEGEMQLEMAQIIEELRAHVKTAELESLGDRATMSYGAGGVVEFVREQGLWKIEELK